MDLKLGDFSLFLFLFLFFFSFSYATVVSDDFEMRREQGMPLPENPSLLAEISEHFLQRMLYRYE